MNQLFTSIIGAALLISTANNVKAQKNEAIPIENELMAIADKAVAFHYQDIDSLMYYDSLYHHTLINYIQNNPNSFKESFTALASQNLLNVITSEDKKMKIYSWESFDNGSMRFYKVMFQYKVGKEIKTQIMQVEDPTDPLYNFTSIYTLNSKEKTYYIALSKNKASNKDVSESIHVFTIETDSVNYNNPLFKTSRATYNRIDVPYDFFSISDNEGQIIMYLPKEKIVKIPIVTEDGMVTPRYIIYKFNGQNFIHTKTETKESK